MTLILTFRGPEIFDNSFSIKICGSMSFNLI